jgi:hypothetical protein
MTPRMPLPLLAGLLAGCAAPALPPDPPDHPAHPNAAATPPPAVTVLAPTALSRQDQPAPPAAASQPTYSCPHHLEVASNHPGACPKCGMALTPKPATQPGGGHDHSAHGGHGGHR